MKYYTDTNNEPYVFDDNVTAEVIAKVETIHKTTLTKITLTAYKKLIAPSFAELQTAKKQEIKTSYNLANEVDIAYMGTIFQADKDSQDLIARNLSIGSVPNGFYWKDKNNNKVAMTYVELQGLGSVIQTRSMGNYGKLSTLKAQTKVAKKQADLDVIVW